MAISETKTQLPLDTFAKIAGINPLHFNQVVIPDLPSRVCGDVLTQYSWQTADKIGREEAAQAIADAEALITNELGFDLLPVWQADDKIELPRPSVPEYQRSYDVGLRGYPLSVHTQHGYTQYGGAEKWTLLAPSSQVVYVDSNGDGYMETAVVTIPNTYGITDKEEIAVVYEGSPTWREIKPIEAILAVDGLGNPIIDIAFKAEQAVRLDLIESFNPQGVDGLVTTNFVAYVDIYRHWNDPSQQVQFVYMRPTCACGGIGCTNCTYMLGTGCIGVMNSRNSILAVSPGNWNGTALSYDCAVACLGADRVNLWYRAGWKKANLATPFLTMDPMWARAVTYLALALMDRPLCGCDALRAFTEHWAEDLAESKATQGGSSNFDLGRVRDNPIGTTRAAIFAWRLILRNKLGEAVDIA